MKQLISAPLWKVCVKISNPNSVQLSELTILFHLVLGIWSDNGRLKFCRTFLITAQSRACFNWNCTADQSYVGSKSSYIVRARFIDHRPIHSPRLDVGVWVLSDRVAFPFVIMDQLPCSAPGVPDRLWTFDNTETVNQFVATADSDHGEGFSSVNFHLGPNQTGLFEGYLSTKVPKEGRVKRSGYCGIRSLRAKVCTRYLHAWTTYYMFVIIFSHVCQYSL